jgi:hypothetical protein
MSALDLFLPLAKVVHAGGFVDEAILRGAPNTSRFSSLPHTAEPNKERTFC